ncbi:MAG: amidohydrolase family protein, partial [Pirellulales bacterium]|nr:amidohydrolase family protein [Pirellulales bacterium]
PALTRRLRRHPLPKGEGFGLVRGGIIEPYTLKARYVFPVVGPPIENGVVVVDENGRIGQVGPARIGQPAEDLGDVALLPGLVNAHTHLEFSQLRQPLGTPGMAFTEWIRTLVENYRMGLPVDAATAIAEGLAESLHSGVTTLGEIAQPGWPRGPFEESPVRATIFLELIAPTGQRIEQKIEAAPQQVMSVPDLDMRWRPGLSPHAPYSVHPRLFDAVVGLSAESGVPVAFHLAESHEEMPFLATADGPLKDLLVEWQQWDPDAHPPGRRPLDFLRRLASAARALVIHGNYLDDEEIAFLGQHADRMAVVYCPRTHTFFGHDDYPLQRLLAAGTTVALGTDSRASSPDLDLLAEIRHAAARHPNVRPATLLELGVLGGAKALGLQNIIGSLTPGKQADLVAVPLDDPQATDPHEALLHSTEPALAVWSAGVRVC